MKNCLKFAFLALVIAPSVQARTLRFEEMSSKQRAQAQELVNTLIKEDVARNKMARLYEAAAAGDQPPMTPETREKIAKGAYMIVASAMASYGVYISESTFTQSVKGILDWTAARGLFPQAFTVGYMARYQVGVGGSVGTQFNFYVDKGELKVASYTLYGLQAGIAEQTKIQFYSALCFGACYGGDPTGFYVGTDFSGAIGLGLDVFLEVGIDFTDAIHAAFNGEKYTLQDLYDSRVVYVGAGFDIGQGGGWSVDGFYYSMDFEKALSSTSEMTQYQLRRKQ